MPCIQNLTFDEIELGQGREQTRILSRGNIDMFAAMANSPDDQLPEAWQREGA